MRESALTTGSRTKFMFSLIICESVRAGRACPAFFYCLAG